MLLSFTKMRKIRKALVNFFAIRKEGLVYDFPLGFPSGEVIVAITRVAKAIYHTTKIIGLSLIVSGVAGFILTFGPLFMSEARYRIGQITQIQKQERERAEEILVKATNKDVDETKKLAQEFGMPNTSFSIYIPKIGARAPVIENVDPGDKRSYMEALKQGVAHAAGSVFPGMTGTTYLFAHSSDAGFSQAKYNTVFYLLRELEPFVPGRVPAQSKAGDVPLGGGVIRESKGDEIYIFFLDKLYKYRVTEKHIVEPNDTSWLSGATKGEERLILQTCWPPGTALKRLIIVAEPVE